MLLSKTYNMLYACVNGVEYLVGLSTHTWKIFVDGELEARGFWLVDGRHAIPLETDFTTRIKEMFAKVGYICDELEHNYSHIGISSNCIITDSGYFAQVIEGYSYGDATVQCSGRLVLGDDKRTIIGVEGVFALPKDVDYAVRTCTPFVFGKSAAAIRGY